MAITEWEVLKSWRHLTIEGQRIWTEIIFHPRLSAIRTDLIEQLQEILRSGEK